MHLCTRRSNEISKTDLRSVSWSYWYSHRSPARGLRKLSGDRIGESYECIRASPIGGSYSTKPILEYRIIDIVCDADMPIGEIRKFCKLQDQGQILIRAAMMQLNLSAHAYHRILKLARTIADLAGCNEIQSVHLAEALQCRQKLIMG